MASKERPVVWPRLQLTEVIKKEIKKKIGNKTYKEYSEKTGVICDVMNLVIGRADSISFEDYEKIFGEKPSVKPDRANGEFSRQMIRLWLYREDMRRTDFYRELATTLKISEFTAYRVVSGMTGSVDIRLEDLMKTKFFEAGLSELEIKLEIEKFEEEYPDVEEKRYSYDEFGENFKYIKKHLGVGYSRRLGLQRWPGYYKASNSRTISEERHQQALELRKRTEQALSSGSYEEIDKLKAEIYGKKPNERIDYRRAEPFVKFLESQGVGIKRVLGRSKSHYEKSLGSVTISKERYSNILKLSYEHILRFSDDTKKNKRLRHKILISMLNITENEQREDLSHYSMEKRGEEYNTGMVIYHPALDDIGVILEMQDNAIDVHFEKKGIKKLTINYHEN